MTKKVDESSRRNVDARAKRTGDVRLTSVVDTPSAHHPVRAQRDGMKEASRNPAARPEVTRNIRLTRAIAAPCQHRSIRLKCDHVTAASRQILARA
jgi:hypothetical protein